MPRMRPLVVVSIFCASSSSFVFAPYPATRSDTEWVRSNRRGYTSTPSLPSSSRFDRRCASCSSKVATLASFHVLPDAVQHPVNELDCVFRAECSRQLQRFVDDDGVRRGFVANELAHGHSENQTIDHRHSLGPPVLGRVGD